MRGAYIHCPPDLCFGVIPSCHTLSWLDLPGALLTTLLVTPVTFQSPPGHVVATITVEVRGKESPCKWPHHDPEVLCVE